MARVFSGGPGWGQVHDSTATETADAADSDLLLLRRATSSSSSAVHHSSTATPPSYRQRPTRNRDSNATRSARDSRHQRAPHRWTVHFADPFIIDAFTVAERTRAHHRVGHADGAMAGSTGE